MVQQKVDSLIVETYEETDRMGQAAASFVAEKLQKSISQQGTANLLLATGASQFEFLKAFMNLDQLDWSKIRTFHLDE